MPHGGTYQGYQDPWAGVGQSANNAIFKYLTTRPTAADQASAQKTQLETQLLQNRVNAPDSIANIFGNILAQNEPQGPTLSGEPLPATAPTPDQINQRYSQAMPELMKTAMQYSGDSVGNLGDTFLAFAANGGASMPQISNAQLGAGQGYEKTIQGVNEAPFTLGPGAIRFNGDGSQRAAAPFKPDSGSGMGGGGFKINLKTGEMVYDNPQADTSYAPPATVQTYTSPAANGQGDTMSDSPLAGTYGDQEIAIDAPEYVDTTPIGKTGTTQLDKSTIKLDNSVQTLDETIAALESEMGAKGKDGKPDVPAEKWKSGGVTGAVAGNDYIGMVNQVPGLNNITKKVGLDDATLTRIKVNRSKMTQVVNEVGQMIVNGPDSQRFSDDDRKAANDAIEIMKAGTDNASALVILKDLKNRVKARLNNTNNLRKFGTGAAGNQSSFAPPPELVNTNDPQFATDPSGDISGILQNIESIDPAAMEKAVVGGIPTAKPVQKWGRDANGNPVLLGGQ